ncbi:hypothetical protein ACIPW5_28120 [Streptomyces sp. NPDC090077]|uniref:hypothetical protein n=1 Tax=Streptomyces sp. NPDC090077 TaxID=3365938 RepID=UPI00380C1D33
MRLRQAAVAVFGAVTLLVTVPSSSSAATGIFEYAYVAPDGTTKWAKMDDPAGGECENFPEAADPNASEPAHSPRNRTTASATVFTETDCEGDWFVLKPLTGQGTEAMKIRSVNFDS